MAFKAIKGTKDMLPQDAYKWHYIEEEWRKICREYGFREIRTPVFEATELFNRGIGDTPMSFRRRCTPSLTKAARRKKARASRSSLKVHRLQ